MRVNTRRPAKMKNENHYQYGVAIMQLSAMQSGERGTVLAYGAGQKAYRQRLLAMGLMPGTVFTVVRVAPLGDPYELTLRGYTLSLRKHEAAMLLVEPVR